MPQQPIAPEAAAGADAQRSANGHPVANADINPIVVQSLPATVGRTVLAMESAVAFAATLRHADQQPFQTYADCCVGAGQDEHLCIFALVAWV